jgi:DNA helicase-2/ATP-dependent DNA helicase PcrA
MRLIADFHLHSAYSRATSRDMHLANIAYWGRLKGVSLLGTGDFTHPAYFQEIREELEETGDGFLRLKNGAVDSPRFILTAETSHIYTQGGRGRRLHMMIFAPGISTAQKIRLFGQGSGQSGSGYGSGLPPGTGSCLDTLVLGVRVPFRV